MINIGSAQLEAWIAAFVWPFLRILALVMAEPLLGHTAVPVRVRVGFALILAIAVSATLPPPPPVALGSAAGMLVAAQQILIGVAMAFCMRILLGALEMAGSLVGLSMGLGFATFFDPQNSAQVPVIGQFTGLLGLLMFFSINGHLMVIAALVESFNVLPISAAPLAAGGFKMLALAGEQIFVLGVVLALPVLTALLIANVAMGVMSRAAPQLNLFAVGFPITLFAGFAVLMMSLPYLAPHMVRMYEEGVGLALRVVGGLAAGH
jgi:flagellar biosynthetic protein FliR